MQTLYPVLKYEDAYAAIDFLEQAFGFERLHVYDGENGGVAHAELLFAGEVVMLGSVSEGDKRFSRAAGLTSVYVVSTTRTPCTLARATRGPRSSWSRPTRSMAPATSSSVTPRATSGASGRTARRREKRPRRAARPPPTENRTRLEDERDQENQDQDKDDRSDSDIHDGLLSRQW